MVHAKRKHAQTDSFHDEFEGLAAFEEISSYKLFRQTKKKGKITLNSKEVKDGRVVKKWKKLPKSQTPKQVIKSDLESPLKKNNEKRKKGKNTLKSRKLIKETPAESGNTIDEPTDEREVIVKPPADKEVADINESAWLSIFTPAPVLEAIRKLGFYEPTEIQKLTIPAAIQGRKDVIGAAETGSGKTLSFAIPMIHGILFDKEKELLDPDSDHECLSDEENIVEESSTSDVGLVQVIDNAHFDFLPSDSKLDRTVSKNRLRAVVVTPTRELAVQVKNHIDAVITETVISTAVVIGGLSQEKQERLLSKEPDIVIGTPGRLWQIIEQGHPHLSQISSIKYLAIDETDRMIERGHFEELHKLLDLINSNVEGKKLRQTFVFSATLTIEHDAPDRLAKNFKKSTKITSDVKLNSLMDLVGLRNNYKIVDATLKSKTASLLSEAKILCEKNEKEYYLYYFLQNFPGRSLVFCNSIDCVKRLNNLFNLLQCQPQALHASKHQKQRLKSLERFTAGPEALLLATDVAARGLDIPNVEHIIHYEMPKTAELYIHRSGRTARASKEGLSILLLDPSDFGPYRKLCTTLDRPADLPSFPVDLDLFNQIKQRVELAKHIEKAEFGVRKENFEENWLKKVSAETDFLSRPNLEDEEIAAEAMKKKERQKTLKIRRHELADMLARPLLSFRIPGRYPTSSGSLNLPKQQNALKVYKNMKAPKSTMKLKKRKFKGLKNKKINKSNSSLN